MNTESEAIAIIQDTVNELIGRQTALSSALLATVETLMRAQPNLVEEFEQHLTRSSISRGAGLGEVGRQSFDETVDAFFDVVSEVRGQ